MKVIVRAKVQVEAGQGVITKTKRKKLAQSRLQIIFFFIIKYFNFIFYNNLFKLCIVTRKNMAIMTMATEKKKDMDIIQKITNPTVKRFLITDITKGKMKNQDLEVQVNFFFFI